jgi:small subunit ribosomal protein S16
VLKIRLRRMGARNRPYYRIVVSDSRLTARAKVLEELGSYDPVPNPPSLSFDRERAKHWIALGATVSPTVASLLERPEAAAPAPDAKAAPAPAATA